MVVVGTGTRGTRFVRTDWPNEDGLTAGTQKQTGRVSDLVEEGNEHFIREDFKELL